MLVREIGWNTPAVESADMMLTILANNPNYSVNLEQVSVCLHDIWIIRLIVPVF